MLQFNIGPDHWSETPVWFLGLALQGGQDAWHEWWYDFAYPRTYRTVLGLLAAVFRTIWSAIWAVALLPFCILFIPFAGLHDQRKDRDARRNHRG